MVTILPYLLGLLLIPIVLIEALLLLGRPRSKYIRKAFHGSVFMRRIHPPYNVLTAYGQGLYKLQILLLTGLVVLLFVWFALSGYG